MHKTFFLLAIFLFLNTVIQAQEAITYSEVVLIEGESQKDLLTKAKYKFGRISGSHD